MDPRTARGVMGKKRSRRYDNGPVARSQRIARGLWSEAEKIAQSQCLVTAKRLKVNAYYSDGADAARLSAVDEGLQTVDPKVGQGEKIRFIPPGPRRVRGLAAGLFLRIIETRNGKAKWAVVERRRASDPQRLDQIFVVPADDCWIERARRAR